MELQHSVVLQQPRGRSHGPGEVLVTALGATGGASGEATTDLQGLLQLLSPLLA